MKTNGGFVIEKDIPIFDNRGAQPKYPLAEMEVGDSFTFPRKSQQSLASIATRYKPKKFALRKLDNETARIWRTL